MCHVRDNVSDHASPEPFVFSGFDQLQMNDVSRQICAYAVVLSLFLKALFLLHDHKIPVSAFESFPHTSHRCIAQYFLRYFL